MKCTLLAESEKGIGKHPQDKQPRNNEKKKTVNWGHDHVVSWGGWNRWIVKKKHKATTTHNSSVERVKRGPCEAGHRLRDPPGASREAGAELKSRHFEEKGTEKKHTVGRRCAGSKGERKTERARGGPKTFTMMARSCRGVIRSRGRRKHPVRASKN